MNKSKDVASFAISFLLAVVIIFYIIAVTALPQSDFESVLRFSPGCVSFFGKDYYLSKQVSDFFVFLGKTRNDFYDMLLFTPVREQIKKSAASLIYAAEELITGLNGIVYFAIHGNM